MFDLELKIKNGSDPVVVPFSFVKRVWQPNKAVEEKIKFDRKGL